MKTDPKTTAGRAFLRSLNILLKFARLYGYDHARVAEQLKTAWSELRAALRLAKVPHFTTLQKAAQRLAKKGGAPDCSTSSAGAPKNSR